MSFCNFSKKLFSLLLLSWLGEVWLLLDGVASLSCSSFVSFHFDWCWFYSFSVVYRWSCHFEFNLFDLNLLWVDFLNWIFELLLPYSLNSNLNTSLTLSNAFYYSSHCFRMQTQQLFTRAPICLRSPPFNFIRLNYIHIFFTSQSAY